jgi:endonuclease/exonuclease/phosphatase family metal-dependent hydrolase
VPIESSVFTPENMGRESFRLRIKNCFLGFFEINKYNLMVMGVRIMNFTVFFKKIIPVFIICFLLAVNVASAENLKVCTWNINKGKNFQRVLDELKTDSIAGCDVLALQEVMPADKEKQARMITSALQATYARGGRDVIVTKLPVVRFGEVRLRPGRNATWADIRSRSGIVFRVYDVHLSYKIGLNPFIPEKRKEEMENILKHAKDFKGSVIVAGDFNTLGWLFGGQASDPVPTLLRNRGYTEASFKGRTNTLCGRIDWIFTKGMKMGQARLGNYAGSDHKWITADVQLQ